jgi:hypothetical protein
MRSWAVIARGGGSSMICSIHSHPIRGQNESEALGVWIKCLFNVEWLTWAGDLPFCYASRLSAHGRLLPIRGPATGNPLAPRTTFESGYITRTRRIFHLTRQSERYISQPWQLLAAGASLCPFVPMPNSEILSTINVPEWKDAVCRQRQQSL